MDRVVGGKFKLGRKLGSGSFGEIFLGVNVQTGEEFAVKLDRSMVIVMDVDGARSKGIAKALRKLGIKTIYQRLSSYNDSEDFKQDVSLLLAPVRLGAQAFSWAAGNSFTTRWKVRLEMELEDGERILGKAKSLRYDDI